MSAENPTLLERRHAPLDDIGQHFKLQLEREHDPRPITLALGTYSRDGFTARGEAYFSASEARALARRLMELAERAELPADV